MLWFSLWGSLVFLKEFLSGLYLLMLVRCRRISEQWWLYPFDLDILFLSCCWTQGWTQAAFGGSCAFVFADGGLTASSGCFSAQISQWDRCSTPVFLSLLLVSPCSTFPLWPYAVFCPLQKLKLGVLANLQGSVQVAAIRQQASELEWPQSRPQGSRPWCWDHLRGRAPHCVPGEAAAAGPGTALWESLLLTRLLGLLSLSLERIILSIHFLIFYSCSLMFTRTL